MTAAAGGAPADDRAFAEAMAALGPFEKHPDLAVAVSGGPDSVALSILARRWTGRRRGTVTALTVDHGLRAESAAEARQVGVWMRGLGIGHRILTLQSQEGWRDAPGGLQAAARTARYRALAGWCRANGVLHLLLGHQLDDQVETFLERLVRGSGLTGLAGMAPLDERHGVRLLRPLLGMTRDQLMAAASAAGQPWVEDRSNADPRFLRARLRRSRTLLEQEGLSRQRLADTVRRLGRARQALDDAVARLLGQAAAIYPHGYAVARARALAVAPDEIRLRALGRLVQAIGGGAYPPREARLEALCAAVAGFAMRGGRLGRTLGGCRVIGRTDGTVLVCRECRAVAPPMGVCAESDAAWDGRFALKHSGADATLQIGAVGPVADKRTRAALAHLPAPVRPTVPALIRNGVAVALPTTGWRACDAPEADPVRVSFVAGPPLAAGRFTVA